MTTYARANTHAAWYQDNFPGSPMKPNCGVLHTTECTALPGYAGGSEAPNYTAVPNWREQTLDWYAHFPDERSSRALVNLAGGVETNTLNCIQVELVGTCDPETHGKWGSQHVRHIYWPEPPTWALRGLAFFLVDMHKRHGIAISSPAGAVWTPYPSSFGRHHKRFTADQWKGLHGWCGHEHVPENDHGDPGAFPWGKAETIANKMLGTAERISSRATRVTRAHDLFDQGIGLLDKAVKAGRKDGLQEVRDAIEADVRRLPVS